MTIRLLSPGLINRIAAGEVVERPASALKELVENALDAGATEIEVRLRQAGQSFLSVSDNGCGIPPDELMLALERHATSKLPEEQLFEIATFGFRGEALPAIAAVSRLTLTSRPKNQDQGWSVRVDGGKAESPRPTRGPFGTSVEVSDLFFATPARLKFLKSERSEIMAIRHLMEQIALANPGVAFKVSEEKRIRLDYPLLPATTEEAQRNRRLASVLGETFAGEAILVQSERKGYKLEAYLGLPTAHGTHTLHQFFFVNGRPIKDKMLASLIKIVYHDVIPQGRFPAIVLFLTVPLGEVDVNVHPAKTEVRFSETTFLKEWLLDVLKGALRGCAMGTTHRLSEQAMASFHRPSEESSAPCVPLNPPSHPFSGFPAVTPKSPTVSGSFRKTYGTSALEETPELKEAGEGRRDLPGATHMLPDLTLPDLTLPDLSSFPLGHAIGQIHSRYIVAQNGEGCLIVDQHAAHERLVYEDLKARVTAGEIESEALLIPFMLKIDETEQALWEENKASFHKLGLDIDILPPHTLMVRSVPALLKGEDWHMLLQDMVEGLRQLQREDEVVQDPIEKALHLILSANACQRRSIKSGRKLSLLEMNELLRQMERTPFAAQCNHGRPTFVRLDMRHLDGLFKRTG